MLMKTVYLLILALCFLLFGSQAFAAGTYNSHATHSTQLRSSNPQYRNFLNFEQDYAIVKNAVINEDIDYAANVDDEDENHFRITVREHIFLINYFLIFSCAFLLSYLFNSIKGRLQSYGHPAFASSYKYLTQRSLRI
jgi:hypothetical protein